MSCFPTYELHISALVIRRGEESEGTTIALFQKYHKYIYAIERREGITSLLPW
jgi:hypothetical protein